MILINIYRWIPVTVHVYQIWIYIYVESVFKYVNCSKHLLSPSSCIFSVKGNKNCKQKLTEISTFNANTLHVSFVPLVFTLWFHIWFRSYFSFPMYISTFNTMKFRHWLSYPTSLRRWKKFHSKKTKIGNWNTSRIIIKIFIRDESWVMRSWNSTHLHRCTLICVNLLKSSCNHLLSPKL